MLDRTVTDWQSLAGQLQIEGRAFINGRYVDALAGATRPTVNPANGQEIAEELGRRRGSTPNPGTIYPALRELEENGLVESRRKGRRKVYSLTERGRQGAIKACEYFCRAYGEIFEEYGPPETRPVQG